MDVAMWAYQISRSCGAPATGHRNGGCGDGDASPRQLGRQPSLSLLGVRGPGVHSRALGLRVARAAHPLDKEPPGPVAPLKTPEQLDKMGLGRIVFVDFAAFRTCLRGLCHLQLGVQDHVGPEGVRDQRPGVRAPRARGRRVRLCRRRLVSFMRLAKATETGLVGVVSRIDLVFDSVGAVVSLCSRLASGASEFSGSRASLGALPCECAQLEVMSADVSFMGLTNSAKSIGSAWASMSSCRRVARSAGRHAKRQTARHRLSRSHFSHEIGQFHSLLKSFSFQVAKVSCHEILKCTQRPCLQFVVLRSRIGHGQAFILQHANFSTPCDFSFFNDMHFHFSTNVSQTAAAALCNHLSRPASLSFVVLCCPFPQARADNLEGSFSSHDIVCTQSKVPITRLQFAVQSALELVMGVL